MRFIIVTWEFEGFHAFPNAPIDVAFLRNEHRHLFKCRAEIEVTHLDRELEFIQVKRFLSTIGQPCQGSCEMMAKSFYEVISEAYGDRRVRVEVWEDGENAGGVMS